MTLDLLTAGFGWPEGTLLGPPRSSRAAVPPPEPVPDPPATDAPWIRALVGLRLRLPRPRQP